ncbi:hypothetical protein PFISCL1PPCAC_25425, partial [Pristionchus fissidentatus]
TYLNAINEDVEVLVNEDGHVVEFDLCRSDVGNRLSGSLNIVLGLYREVRVAVIQLAFAGNRERVGAGGHIIKVSSIEGG